MNQRIQRKSFLALLLLFFLLFAAIVVSINSGYTPVPLDELFKVFLFQGSAKYNLIIGEFRLPRILIAVLAGMGLALSGTLLQGISNNPLADPGLLGINAGAGLIVVIFIALGGLGSFASVYTLPFLALLGGTLSGTAIFLLSRNAQRGLQPVRLVLNGIALQAGIFALMSLIIIGFDDAQHEFLANWQAGSIWSSDWDDVKALAPWILILASFLMSRAKHLDILACGDDSALGLGLAIKKEKALLLFLSIALAGASVAFTGSISFVGLMGPHLARRLFGSRHRALLPASALIGALLVLVADTLGRTLISPSEIPAGIMVSVLGAPYFIVLLLKGRRRGK